MSKRVVFTFDDNSFERLQAIVRDGGYASMAAAVRDSLGINRALLSQSAQGYTEVLVRNPSTSEQKVMVI